MDVAPPLISKGLTFLLFRLAMSESCVSYQAVMMPPRIRADHDNLQYLKHHERHNNGHASQTQRETITAMSLGSFAREWRWRGISGRGVGAIGDGPVRYGGRVVDGVGQDAPVGLTESFRQVKSGWIIHISFQLCFGISNSRRGGGTVVTYQKDLLDCSFPFGTVRPRH